MFLPKTCSWLGITIGSLMVVCAVSFLVPPSKGANIAVEDSSDKRSEGLQSKIDEFISDGFGFKLKQTREEIIKTLGAPEKTKIQKVKNPYYPGDMDEIHELFYRGLYIRIHEVGATRQEFITDIAISDDRYKLKWGLNVGSQKSTVKQVLGKPDKGDKNLFEYHSETDYVTFHFLNEIVNKVAWTFYLD